MLHEFNSMHLGYSRLAINALYVCLMRDLRSAIKVNSLIPSTIVYVALLDKKEKGGQCRIIRIGISVE